MKINKMNEEIIKQIDALPLIEEIGYTEAQLKTIFSEDLLSKFFHWMDGQTVGVSEDAEALYYPEDVIRFLRGANSFRF